MDAYPALQVTTKHVTHASVQKKDAQTVGTREMQTRNLSNITSIPSKMTILVLCQVPEVDRHVPMYIIYILSQILIIA